MSNPKQPRRPLSIQNRLLLASGVVLLLFLGATGLALDEAFRRSSEQALHDRLQGYLWAYLSGIDVSVGRKLIPPEYPPDPRFDRPQSGLYAGIVGDGVDWTSQSALGHKLPFQSTLAPNAASFVGPLETDVGRVYIASLGVSWEVPNKKDVQLTLHVAQSDADLSREIAVYRRSLWSLLAGLAVGLLVVQVMVLRWSARPLRQVARDLADIESGRSDRLSGRYPQELQGLTESLNDFIEGERERRQRYRNTLSDLAHSLKTPLAVLRNADDDSRSADELRSVVGEQVERMDDIVAYQLSRAATSGHATLAAPIPIEEHAEQIVRGLERVYAESKILCEFEIHPDARFYGAEGDLMELLGNLLENAFKWARGRVCLTVCVVGPSKARRPGLSIDVEDDGPGIPPEKVEHLMQRGVRGDERVAGHGIGLAIVQDIVNAYRGTLDVSRSEEFGGARFSVVFAPL